MAEIIQCSFCNQSFEFDRSTGRLLATCPHCGKESANINVRGQTQHLKLLRDAPSLTGVKFCVRCKKRNSQDAVLCVHCGYNWASGKRQKGIRVARTPGVFRWLLVICLIGGGLGAITWWYTGQMKSAELAQPTTGLSSTKLPAEVASSQGEAVSAAEPADPELQRDEQALFAAKQAAALESYRRILDQQQPMFQTNEIVELRLRTGQIVRGKLLYYAGGRTNRIAVISNEKGKQLIEVQRVDLQTRLRMDAFLRENYMRKKLNMPPMPPPERTSTRAISGDL